MLIEVVYIYICSLWKPKQPEVQCFTLTTVSFFALNTGAMFLKIIWLNILNNSLGNKYKIKMYIERVEHD